MPSYYGRGRGYQNRDDRGRPRWRGRGSYGRSRSDHRSSYQDNDSQKQNLSEIYQAIGSLAQEIKDLKQQFSTFSTEQTSVKTRLGSRVVDPQNQDNNRNRDYLERADTRSHNPDFGHYAWDCAQFVRLEHQMANWETFPKKLNDHVDELINNINPPIPSSTLRDCLDRAGEDFKNSILVAVQAHLKHQSELKLASMASYNSSDEEMIHTVARKIVKRRYAHNFSESAINEAFDKVRVGVKRRKGYNDAAHLDPSEFPPLHQEHNKRARQSDTSGELEDVEGPTPTGGRSDKRANLDTNTQVRDTVVVPSASNDTVHNLATLNAQHSVKETVICMNTKPPVISELPQEIDTVMIMDSNGRSFRSLSVPGNIQIFAFPGARIEHIAPLLERSQDKLSNVHTIVFGVGINNRNDLDSDISNSIQDLKDIRIWCHHKKIRLCWTGIPLFDVYSRARANIDILNRMARDVFDQNYLHSLDLYDIRLENAKSNNIHYSPVSADILLTKIINFLCD